MLLLQDAINGAHPLAKAIEDEAIQRMISGGVLWIVDYRDSRAFSRERQDEFWAKRKAAQIERLNGC
jgi:hypothetical protein